jgi:hypothetical protein
MQSATRIDHDLVDRSGIRLHLDGHEASSGWYGVDLAERNPHRSVHR